MNGAMRAGWMLVLALACTSAAADIYAFTDEAGVTHFSNVPTDARYQRVLDDTGGPVRGEVRRDDRWLARSAEFESLIERTARAVQLDPALLRAIIAVESGFDPRAVSRRGALGLMQLMPATAKRFGVSDAFDPAQNVAAGARYLRVLTDRFDDDLELVLAAYNAGEAAVERHGRRIPPYRETRRYVPRVLQVYRTLLEPGQGG